MKSRMTLSLLVVAMAGVTAGMFIREAIVPASLPTAAPVEQTTEPASTKPAAPTPQEIAGPHLRWAADEAESILDEHLQEISDFFAEAKRHSPHFAERALGWGSKWRMVADHVPFTRGGRHEAFLRKQFEDHLFRPDELKRAVEQAVAGYLAHIRSIESQMLVRVRTDVADFPDTYLVAGFDETAWQTRYEEVLAQALAAAKSDLHVEVATLIVTEIAGTVLADVALKLGVSAGILGTGAASSWTTFGVGLVVGLIVDQIVSWVWDWYADPKGNLASELTIKLDSIRRLIVDGSGDVPGLRSRLKTYADERARLRETAVLALLESR